MTPFAQFLKGIPDTVNTGMNIIGQAFQIEKAAAFDRIEANLAQESMRFRESLKTDEDYDQFISEDGSTGKYAEFRKRMEGMVKSETGGKLYQDQALVFLKNSLVNDEQYARQFQAQQMVNVGLKKSIASTVQILSTVKDDPATCAAEMSQRYADGLERFVNSGVMLKDTYDAVWKENMTPFVENNVVQEVRKVLDMGGMEAVTSFAGWLQANPAYLAGGDDVPAVTFDKDTVIAIGQKESEARRKLRAEAWDKEMSDTLLIGKNIPMAKEVLGKARADMEDTQYRYWAGVLDAQLRPSAAEQNRQQDEVDENVKAAYFAMERAGAPRAEREKFINGFQGIASTDLLRTLAKQNNSPEYEDAALAGVIDKVRKDKKIDDAKAGEIVWALQEYAQTSRNLTDPRKYDVFLKDLLAEDFRKELSDGLKNYTRGGWIAMKSPLEEDPLEKYQKRIQAGEFSGLVIAWPVNGKDGKSNDFVFDAPNIKSLKVFYEGQKSLIPQDFGADVKYELRYANNGQMSFLIDGKEYAYMIPEGGFDEALMVKNKDSWVKTESPSDLKAKQDKEAKKQADKNKQAATAEAEKKAIRGQRDEQDYGRDSIKPPNFKGSIAEWNALTTEERKKIKLQADPKWLKSQGIINI
jgi:hypothetical protein